MITRTVIPVVASVCLGAAAAHAQQFVPITDEILNHPSDDDWPQYRRTHDAWAHSPLTQIDKENVGFLQLAWSRAIGPGAMEMTPLVYRGVMYLVHPNDRIEAGPSSSARRPGNRKMLVPTIALTPMQVTSINVSGLAFTPGFYYLTPLGSDPSGVN